MSLTGDEILMAELSEPQRVLWRVIEALRNGRTPSDSDAKAHADALDAILSGADPKRALGLTGRRGQGRKPKTSSQMDETELNPVIRIERLRRKGMKRDEAIARIAREEHIAEGTLIGYHKRNREAAVWLLNFLDFQQKKRGGKK